MADEKDPGLDAGAEGVDAADLAEGAEPAADESQSSGPKVTTEELIALRQKAERLNSLERRHGTDFEQRLAQPPAAPEDDEPEGAVDDAGGDEDLAATIKLAKGDPARGILPDPVARLQLKKMQQDARKERLRDQLDEILDPAKKAAVRAHFLKNQHRLGDIKAAQAEVDQEAKDARIRELEAQLKNGRSTEPKVNRVPTTPAEIPGAVTKPRAMTLAQFQKENEAAGMFAGMKMQRDLREGRIVLTD